MATILYSTNIYKAFQRATVRKLFIKFMLINGFAAFIHDFNCLKCFFSSKDNEYIPGQRVMEVILIDSLNPDEIKKKLTTVYVMATAGGNMVHQTMPPPIANRADDVW